MLHATRMFDLVLLCLFLMINSGDGILGICVRRNVADLHQEFHSIPSLICPNIPVPLPKTIYVLGDLHGDLANTIAILQAAHLVPEEYQAARGQSFIPPVRWTGGRSILVQLGDIVDRGPDSPAIYRLFQALKEQANKEGGEVHHLMGNHEGLNLCGDWSSVSPEERTTYFQNDFKRWMHAWSPTGEIGQYVRKEFEIVKVLFGRLLFVHAGLMQAFSRFTPEELKSAFLHRVNRGCPNPTTMSGATPSSYEDLIAERSSGFYDPVYGRDSPTWTRMQSTAKESTACPAVREALATASKWPVVQNQQRRLVVDAFMMAIAQRNNDSSARMTWDEHRDVLNESFACPNNCTIVRGLHTMIVGHTPVMAAFGTEQLDLIVRCQNQTTTTASSTCQHDNRFGTCPNATTTLRSNEDDAEGGSRAAAYDSERTVSKSGGSYCDSVPSSSGGYIMADAGISSSMADNIKFLQIDASFVPKCFRTNCPLLVTLDFHQVALHRKRDGRFDRLRTLLMTVED